MTLYDFRALNEPEQFEVTWAGTFLADRQEPGYNVLLYCLGEFYVEVYFSIVKQAAVGLRAFKALHLLEPYLNQINNSDLNDLI